MKTTIYTLTSDDNSGMSTQVLTTREELRIAIIKTVSDAQQDEDSTLVSSLEACEMDGEQWEALIDDWKQSAEFSNCYYSWEEHEIELPDCPALVDALRYMVEEFDGTADTENQADALKNAYHHIPKPETPAS